MPVGTIGRLRLLLWESIRFTWHNLSVQMPLNQILTMQEIICSLVVEQESTHPEHLVPDICVSGNQGI